MTNQLTKLVAEAFNDAVVRVCMMKKDDVLDRAWKWDNFCPANAVRVG